MATQHNTYTSNGFNATGSILSQYLSYVAYTGIACHLAHIDDSFSVTVIEITFMWVRTSSAQYVMHIQG